MMFFSYQWMSVLSFAALYMKFHGDARFVANEAEGYLSLNTTLSGVGAAMLSTAAYAPPPGGSTPPRGEKISPRAGAKAPPDNIATPTPHSAPKTGERKPRIPS